MSPQMTIYMYGEYSSMIQIAPVRQEPFLQIFDNIRERNALLGGNLFRERFPASLHYRIFSEIISEKHRVVVIFGMPVFECPSDCFLQDIGVKFLSIQYLVQIVVIFHSAALIREVNDCVHLFRNDSFK